MEDITKWYYSNGKHGKPMVTSKSTSDLMHYHMKKLFAKFQVSIIGGCGASTDGAYGTSNDGTNGTILVYHHTIAFQAHIPNLKPKYAQNTHFEIFENFRFLTSKSLQEVLVEGPLVG